MGVKRKTIKRRFVVEIEVDPIGIAKKHDDYDINYKGPEDFIKREMLAFTYCADTNMAVNGLKEWGYAKRIVKEIL